MLSGEALTAERIAGEVAAMVEETGAGLGDEAEARVVYEMRYAGQAFELPVPGPAEPDPAELVEEFERAHEERYGHRDPEGAVVLVDIDLALVVPGPAPRPVAAGADEIQRSTRRVHFDGEWVETPVLRGEPAAGFEAEGPVVFELPEATLVLPPDWSASVDNHGSIIARFETVAERPKGTTR
jgi:N-methylhydantoinase A